jgi:AcrR family transcriptional regulator
MVKINSQTKWVISMNETELKILAAAREEFVKMGLKGARMQIIADSAGVNKALLHYYFRSKEKLFEATIGEFAERLWGALEMQFTESAKYNNLKSFISTIVRTYIKTLSSDRYFPRLILRDIADGGDVMRTILKRAAERFGSIPAKMFTALKKEMDSGVIIKINPVDIILNILGMCIFTFIPGLVFDDTVVLDKLGLTYDDAYYENRISAIITMTCDGIFLKDDRK